MVLVILLNAAVLLEEIRVAAILENLCSVLSSPPEVTTNRQRGLFNSEGENALAQLVPLYFHPHRLHQQNPIMLLPYAEITTVAADELLKIMLLLPLPLMVPPSSSTGIYFEEKC